MNRILFILLFNTLAFSQAFFSLDEIMPVELIYFEAQKYGDAVLLRWGTATEVNNYGFNIERSNNLNNWITIGFVFGHGTSYSPKHYLFWDSSVTPVGKYYYKLKQIDTNGQFKYSDTVSVTFSTTSVQSELQSLINNVSLDFFPNPFNSVSNISLLLKEKRFVEMTVYSLVGEKILDLCKDILDKGIHLFRIDLSGKPSNVYFLKLKMEDKFTLIKKLILLK